MIREEAIKMLIHTKEFLIGDKICWSKYDCHIKAIDMAIEAIETVQKHEETFEWCHDCKEYDQENHCCYRWSKVIKQTGLEMEKEFGIVRCKDCKHVQRARSEEAARKFGQIYICGQHVFLSPKPDDFCSMAERRTG